MIFYAIESPTCPHCKQMYLTLRTFYRWSNVLFYHIPVGSFVLDPKNSRYDLYTSLQSYSPMAFHPPEQYVPVYYAEDTRIEVKTSLPVRGEPYYMHPGSFAQLFYRFKPLLFPDSPIDNSIAQRYEEYLAHVLRSAIKK